jgi:hypothetical protein
MSFFKNRVGKRRVGKHLLLHEVSIRLGHGMMSGMGLVWILGIVLLILGIAAAIKYLHSRRSGGGHKRVRTPPGGHRKRQDAWFSIIAEGQGPGNDLRQLLLW